ncbi:MAG TPA: transketolase, partial [Firmicutes bacterium]|nr:transketolase [Bacillota bacterium]
ANETAVCWQIAIERRRPVAIVLTRQALPILDPEKYAIGEGVRRGAYILGEAGGKPDVILIATGSEVHLALEASRELAKRNIKARVVSMPSWEIFVEQSSEYHSHVLPHDVPRLSIEAGVTLGWQKFTGLDGETLGLDRFGSSAPGKVVYERLGFSVTEVISRALKLVRS